MNEQLKLINTKIRLLNDVMAINALFNPNEKHISTVIFSEQKYNDILTKFHTKYQTNSIMNRYEILKIAKKLRDMFSNKEVFIKRKVVNDRLVSIRLHLAGTDDSMPLNPQTLTEMLSCIKT